MARPKQNLYGQEMGTKGLQKREKIIKTTAELLVSRPLREIKVADIAKSGGFSTSTFYLYFETVNDAALAAIEQVNQSSQEIMDLLDEEWTFQGLLANCRKLIAAYFAIWDENQALLRVRNFMADEGDRRFIDARRRSIESIHLALQDKCRTLQVELDESNRLDPASTASVLLAALERTAQIVRLPSAHRTTRPRMVESLAYLLAAGLCGAAMNIDGVGEG